jgi:hypothetical protein
MVKKKRNEKKSRELSPTAIIKNKARWVLVAHACNPSYSGGTDQED